MKYGWKWLRDDQEMPERYMIDEQRRDRLKSIWRLNEGWLSGAKIIQIVLYKNHC